MQNLKVTQNYLVNKRKIAQLVAEAKIQKNDTVYDLGMGSGNLTSELLRRSDNVIGMELDETRFEKLVAKFAEYPNVTVLNQDVLKYEFPSKPFKIFSNIPFNISAELFKKIVRSNFKQADIIVQSEFAKKYIGEQMGEKNNLQSVLAGAQFQFKLVTTFHQFDFKPVSSVEIVMMRITRRPRPLVSQEQSKIFADFVTYVFSKSSPKMSALMDLLTFKQFVMISKQFKLTKTARPTEISIEAYCEIFNLIMKYSPDKLNKLKGTYAMNKMFAEKIEKVNRTRSGTSATKAFANKEFKPSPSKFR
jgi:23S rRNA (adenine-N6)-dimethyltransferase